MNNKDPLIISFALRNDIPLRFMLGLSTLLSMGATLITFHLLLDLPGKGLPDGVSLPASDIYVPLSVPSNLASLVNFTAMDGFAYPTLNHATPSDNIMVHDSVYHGSVSRNLSFVPSSNNSTT